MIKKYEDLFKESRSWLAERNMGKQKMLDEYRLLISKAQRKANLSYEQGKKFEAQGLYWETLIHYQIAVTTFSNVSTRISELKQKIHG